MKELKKPRGGARPGAGRKPGGKNQATITKEAAREALRQIVLRDMEALVGAQLDNAKGIRHLMMRDPKSGKFERVAVSETDPDVAAAQIDAALQSGNACWIYTKDPSVQAFTDLMNRAIDKPAEQVQEVKVDGELVLRWQS